MGFHYGLDSIHILQPSGSFCSRNRWPRSVFVVISNGFLQKQKTHLDSMKGKGSMKIPDAGSAK